MANQVWRRTPISTGPTVQVGVGDTDAAKKRLEQILNKEKFKEHWTGGQVTDYTTARGQEIEKQQQDAEMSRINREIDLARGRERGQQDFYEGALGRVGTAPSSEIQELQSQRMDIAREGFGAGAFQAAREQRLDDLNRFMQSQRRDLAASQGSTGVYGGLAGAQRMELGRQQQESRQDAERQLFLDEVNRREGALGAAEATVRGTEADTLQREQYNQNQRKSELMGLLTAQYGEAALGVAERTAAMSSQAAKDYAASVAAQGGGKK